MCSSSRRRMTWVPRSEEGQEGEAAGRRLLSSGIQRTGSSRSSPTATSAHENLWVGEARVPMSDLERTLLDCLSMPQHCGAISERHSTPSKSRWTRLNIERITEYAIRLGVTTAKRLGWALEAQGVLPFELEDASSVAYQGLPQA